MYMNTVSCWPVTNDDKKPTKVHLHACRKNLADQLDLVGPYVLALGQTAREAMIRHGTKHTHERLIPIHGKLVYPTYHPAFILYRKEQEEYMKWKAAIATFVHLMHFEAKGWMDQCVYCTRPCYDDNFTCYRHRKEWRLDQVWSQTLRRRKKDQIKGQGELFNG